MAELEKYKSLTKASKIREQTVAEKLNGAVRIYERPGKLQLIRKRGWHVP